MDLEQRIARLEDLEAIRQLKARYFHCCDGKDPQGMRACFAEGPVDIDYGALGRFTDRDALVALFTQLGCHPHIVEMHHGANPDISLTGEGRASGVWSLHYQQIDTQKQTVTQLGAVYYDAYVKVDGAWKIGATRCQVNSLAVLAIGDGVPRVVQAGKPV